MYEGLNSTKRLKMSVSKTRLILCRGKLILVSLYKHYTYIMRINRFIALQLYTHDARRGDYILYMYRYIATRLIVQTVTFFSTLIKSYLLQTSIKLCFTSFSYARLSHYHNSNRFLFGYKSDFIVQRRRHYINRRRTAHYYVLNEKKKKINKYSYIKQSDVGEKSFM